jgi:hypothetical protein
MKGIEAEDESDLNVEMAAFFAIRCVFRTAQMSKKESVGSTSRREMTIEL